MHYLSVILYFKVLFCRIVQSCKTLPDDKNSENQIPIIAISPENRPVDILFVVLINDDFKKSQTSLPDLGRLLKMFYHYNCKIHLTIFIIREKKYTSEDMEPATATAISIK